MSRWDPPLLPPLSSFEPAFSGAASGVTRKATLALKAILGLSGPIKSPVNHLWSLQEGDFWINGLRIKPEITSLTQGKQANSAKHWLVSKTLLIFVTDCHDKSIATLSVCPIICSLMKRSVFQTDDRFWWEDSIFPMRV